MDADDLNILARKVLHNCDISDAYHSGLFSICGLALRLRDLYKWEKRLPPWEERDSSEILDWIESKENQWEKIAENNYAELPIFDKSYDPFDADGINAVLEPAGIFYGAGYARSLKPTFFLAAIEDKSTINGTTVYTLGHELARDLLTIPALAQNDSILLRQESAKLYIWDKLFYINKSARPILEVALDQCGIKETDPKMLRDHLDTIIAVVNDTYIYHELGEIRDTTFERTIWREIIAAFPASPVEFLARAVKDLLSDTSDHGPLRYFIRERKMDSLAFYVAFFDGLAKTFFPELFIAFQEFLKKNDWRIIEHAVTIGHDTAMRHAETMVSIYQEGIQKENLEWAETEIQQRLLGKYLPNT